MCLYQHNISRFVWLLSAWLPGYSSVAVSYGLGVASLKSSPSIHPSSIHRQGLACLSVCVPGKQHNKWYSKECIKLPSHGMFIGCSATLVVRWVTLLLFTAVFSLYFDLIMLVLSSGATTRQRRLACYSTYSTYSRVQYLVWSFDRVLTWVACSVPWPIPLQRTPWLTSAF